MWRAGDRGLATRGWVILIVGGDLLRMRGGDILRPLSCGGGDIFLGGDLLRPNEEWWGGDIFLGGEIFLPGDLLELEG